MLKSALVLPALALAGWFAAGAPAQQPAATAITGHLLAIVTAPARSGATLTVSSPAFPPGGDIPMDNTQYGRNFFPGLSWSAGPAGTKSYVVVVQDPDGKQYDNNPVLHWTLINVPADVTSLEAAMSQPPPGAANGPNVGGRNQPYLGPKTPPGPKHHYHFQVFALDRKLSWIARRSYARMLAAMQGHVLASGETVGLGQAPAR